MITRPDGRPYRPRKPGLRAHAWENDDEQGVIVFGTLDPAAAQAFALDSSTYWYGAAGAVVDPEPDWFRCWTWTGWPHVCRCTRCTVGRP